MQFPNILLQFRLHFPQIDSIFVFFFLTLPAGFLVDKFGKYKPVVVMSLLLNAIFHHSLLFIPQQEIPGVVPSAFVLRHPDSGDIEVRCSDTEKIKLSRYTMKTKVKKIDFIK